ncbi:MAG TPA: MBL fold metallo-hydrolase [Sedimentisphaerales bacterium]|nr:MBL fold metallo-hydrolase [Sedimentisphaerales bacterium]
MKLDALVLGEYETNCYVLRSDGAAHSCLVIDTGLSPEPLLDFLRAGRLKPLALFLTHAHADHIAGAKPLRTLYPDMKIGIHKADASALLDPHANLATLVGEKTDSPPADAPLDDNQIIEIAGIRLKVIHTPGHTPGCICLYSEADGVLFSGDTLFAGSVGATDFPTSAPDDYATMISSIRTRLMTLPPETTVYPGHGPATTLGNEARFNPHLQHA